MNWKEFLKPTSGKIIIFIMLSIILSLVKWWWLPKCYDCGSYQGFPLPIYSEGGFIYHPKTFIPINFVINIIIWYTISCLIIFIYNKLKKKRKKRRK